MVEKVLYYTGETSSPERKALETSLQLAFVQRENVKQKALLRSALERLEDMLKMDDGQAFKEADKFVTRELRPYLNKEEQIDVV